MHRRAPEPAATTTHPDRRTTVSPFAALRTHNFQLFVASQVFAYTGGWIQRIAQDWLVLELTGSATAVGITVALQFLPSLFFGPFGGVIALGLDLT